MDISSGKGLHNYGKSLFRVNFPMKIVMFHSYIKLPDGKFGSKVDF